MKYIEFTVKLLEIGNDDAKEIIVAELAERGFESFSGEDDLVKAYINEEDFSVYKTSIYEYLRNSGYGYEQQQINNDINWNAEWESAFNPIDINGKCYIRAPFHEKKNGYQYTITIMPKMSFGTGHHATTRLMVESLLETGLKGKTGLDMGSGTGLLAILAIKAGALEFDAIDIDEWAYENCIENIRVNSVSDKINVFLGESSLLKPKPKYDIVLANINRNIILQDIDKYSSSLKDGGEMLLSGFLTIDSEIIENNASRYGLSIMDKKSLDGWCMLKFKKNNNGQK